MIASGNCLMHASSRLAVACQAAPTLPPRAQSKPVNAAAAASSCRFAPPHAGRALRYVRWFARPLPAVLGTRLGFGHRGRSLALEHDDL